MRKLEPGCWLTYDSSGTIETGRYWKLPQMTAQEPAGFSEERACEELRNLFDESVRMRMIADVPLGAFLSGGIDSSLGGCLHGPPVFRTGEDVLHWL